MKSYQKGKRSRGVGNGSNKLMMEFGNRTNGVLFELVGAGSVVVVVVVVVTVTATDNGGLHFSSFSIHSFTIT